MLADPAWILLLGALPVPLLRGRWRTVWMLALPVVALVLLWTLPEGSAGTFEVFGLTLEPMRVDALGRVFATVFLIAACLGLVYSLHEHRPMQQIATLAYAGAAVGGVLAGDLLTLFICWELVGIASVVLVFARGTDRSFRAGQRYLVVQVLSGILLLAGIALWVRDGHGLAFEYIGLDGFSGGLILFAVGIKAAFPVVHAWLPDIYPEAGVVGTVILSTFTTKFAIYVLARGFADTELLVWVGAVMAVFPIFYALIENDLRRVLVYSLINQLGFIVVGIGIGGELGVNGAVAHAFAHILYKSLLFMAMGAVLFRVGTIKGSELGGLYRSMPQTAVFCMIGAASTAAVPLFSGFATKSMIMDAAGQEHRLVLWLVLLLSSVGVLLHTGIKIPYIAFFGRDRGHRVAEAPINMRVAMGLSAAACLVIGIVPGLLYNILPFAVDYSPYTTAHVVNQLQLLIFAALAFTVLIRTGRYPPELRSVNLDADVLYRKSAPYLWRTALAGVAGIRAALPRERVAVLRAKAARPLRPDGRFAELWSTGTTVWWLSIALGLVLLFSLL
ncbi:Na(+)/H(+) antiporter subunit D [Nocardia uniformis]|uniref:Na(+)/H(+) antiporter subunit D n=1 Tax=Nocardia uniformis TaxID=53432 RepID=A0A849CBF3_9NOCA|nr:Na(+)/H(+) antiporter subunit D [Nocardia uniformis]NNH75176.1 Na(+)/H(+) antiporter subunit D [Nocardia uniformis]